MVKLTRIYTRGGDAGETSLGDGRRLAKHDTRIAAIGAVDAANAAGGVARLHAAGEADAMLGRIQNDLFDLGADLCTPHTGEGDGTGETGRTALRIVAAQVVRLEKEIDRLNGELTPLESFVLPGGTPAAAHLHVARTAVRRAERLMVALAARENVNADALRYVNRLSDLLFVLGRWLNGRGALDVLWTPGQNR